MRAFARKSDHHTESRKTPFFSRVVQPKIEVGAPNDQYEQEADKVAAKVVDNSTGQPKEKDEKIVQQKSIADTVLPYLQKQSEEEDKPVQTQEKETVLQKEEEKEKSQPKLEDDKEPVQKKEEEEIQSKTEEEGDIQTKTDESNENITDIEPALKREKGNGSPLSKGVRAEMENGFGADFSQVKIHNNTKAVQMNQALGAQAFTHGNDVFFNQGKYNPGSKEGKLLLAHELTHTIQQNGRTQKKKANTDISPTNFNVQGGFWSRVWSGVKSVGSAIWSGVTSVAGYGWNVLKSAGAWVWDLVTEAPGRIWNLLKHIGSGIVGTISWIWDGIKGALGQVWSGITGVLSWLKDGVAGLFSWIWRGLKGGANWAYKLLHGDFSGFWEGIGNFFSWMGDGVVGLAKWGWDGLKGAAMWAWMGVKGFAKWIWEGFKSGAAWLGRLIAKLLDMVGFGEIMDLLFNIFKVNTRTLTSIEQQEAFRVFQGSISYWQVRIDEASLISAIGSFFSGGGGMGVTLFHTINFNQKLHAAAGNSDMRWLIHELTHVSQYEHVGSQYIGEAIHAQATIGYSYGDGAGLAGKNLKDFNREQQADIIAHYYFYILSGNTDPRFSGYAIEYQRMINQARSGKF
ncbi:MAG TPA: DUF4157 domain-containing protein [Prolixibacteraceae bacterium]|nr:DUF4157 domain-containing protein [Prolixibacteraceae bacterium]